MKAIIILHDGATISGDALAKLVAEVAILAGITGELKVHQLNDKEVAQVITKEVALTLNCNQEDDATVAICKGIDFIKRHYLSYLISGDFEGMKMQIICDLFKNTEEAKMLKNTIIALSACNSQRVVDLGLPQEVLEVFKLIKNYKFV